MSYKPSYDKGDWIAVCDSCGRYYKASTMRKRWDGLMVCNADWEPRQPQDYVRGKAERQIPTWTRSKSEDTYILGCTTQTAIVGYASAGCLIAGNTIHPGEVPASTFTL
jgi:hypothetical protein